MKDIEQVLLNNASLDELIKMKIDEEFKPATKKSKVKAKVTTDLSKVPRNRIFTKDTIFRVYNRKNHTQSCVDGLQAEAMLGVQNEIREKILSGTLTAFSTDDTYVKFEKAVLKHD